MTQKPGDTDRAGEPSLPDGEQVAKPDPPLRDADGVGAPEDPGVTVGESTFAVRTREAAVADREETATRREGAADVREEAAGLREETSRLREEAFRAREDAVHAKTRLEQSEQASHAKDEFLAAVSHELRTPLNALMGWARMLKANQLAPDRANHAMESIERNASALAHIIDDLLDVSRMVAGTLRLASQSVDLVGVTRAALDAVRPLAGTKNIALTFTPPRTALATVSGDAGRLEQVIWSLLENAIKFTPEGGRVDIVIGPSKDNHLEVHVVDTGEGISPDFLPYVFDRFRQADSATTRRHTGLGLGLAIVRQLVELHRGTVHAASEGVGHGATFTVRLPIAADEAHPPCQDS